MSTPEPDLTPWERAQRGIEDILREFLGAAMAEDQPERPYFLTDWVVVVAGHLEDGNGSSSSVYNRLVRDDQPPHVTLGLLDYERTSYRAYLERDGDGE